jgi:hypothetical protein
MKTIIKDFKDWWLGVPIEQCIDSKVSRQYLLAQIEQKFGKAVADNTNLEEDVKSLGLWSNDGYRIKAGTKALYGLQIRNVPRNGRLQKLHVPVRLFHRCQVRLVRY